MQIGFYFNQSRCTGCYTCSIACKDWHDIQDDSVQWRRVIPLEKGRYPNVSLSYISLSCNHCEHPLCSEACPAGAITKRKEDGIMVVDQAQCLGKDRCEMFCRQACPYQVPQFGTEEDVKMQMCTLCLDRFLENKRPVCVDACPMRALDAGPMDELKKKYGDQKEVEGFVCSLQTKPSVVFTKRY